jgi:hypothetical protein
MEFDCKVCPECSQPMSAASFENHVCGMDRLGIRNGAGIERAKLHASTGRPKGARNINAKHPSSIGRKFMAAGLDWQTDFALAIKHNRRERIKLWLRLLPYLVTTTNRVKVRKWKGRASRAALIALDALEGKNESA